MSFRPQAYTVPFDFRASPCASPAATAVTLDNVPTATGVDLSIVVPSPSCPFAFWPQAQPVVSDLMAREKFFPAPITRGVTEPVTVYAFETTSDGSQPVLKAVTFRVKEARSVRVLPDAIEGSFVVGVAPSRV